MWIFELHVKNAPNCLRGVRGQLLTICTPSRHSTNVTMCHYQISYLHCCYSNYMLFLHSFHCQCRLHGCYILECLALIQSHLLHTSTNLEIINKIMVTHQAFFCNWLARLSIWENIIRNKRTQIENESCHNNLFVSTIIQRCLFR